MSSALVPLSAAADDDAPPGGYPSWQDVQNARQNEASKAEEVHKIEALLSGLKTQEEELGNAAVRSAAEYAAAASALDAARAKVDALTAQVARADAAAAGYKKETGALAAQAYKAGGANAGLFAALDALESKDGLQRLDVLQLVMDRSSVLFNESVAAEGAAKAMAEQERAAKAERERLAGEAKAKLDAAQEAQASMARTIAQEKQHDQELTAQLASLKGTSAAIEDQYRQGQAALAAYRAAQEAKRAAAERARQQPAPGVVSPTIPGGAINDPAAAQNYAAGRLGSFGWGTGQSQCLVRLWNRESNWLTNATNPSSGAYGIAQALPPGKYSSAGSDWLTNYRTQIEWGLGYIRDRYGTPCVAWDHETSTNWY